MFGIINEADYYKKQRDFEAWLVEVKKMSAIIQDKWEVKELFKEYVEDFNTVTLPHEKYYNYAKWEMAQYKKREMKAARANKERSTFNDEAERKKEQALARKKKQEEEFKMIMATMDKSKVQAMRDQKHLESEMQMHFKTGNTEELERIRELMAPDEDEDTMKYKHKRGVAETAFLSRD